jgi:hypothetical protein
VRGQKPGFFAALQEVREFLPFCGGELIGCVFLQQFGVAIALCWLDLGLGDHSTGTYL